MAIAEYTPQKDFTPTPSLPKVQPDNYMGLTYDDKQTPLVSLQAYLEGSPWTVTYYPQILGEHNDLKELDTGLSPQYQSYQRIDMMELRLEQDLGNGQTDGTSQLSSVSGSALVYAFLEPNINDYFVANTSQQREALFRVTEVNRHTWRRESVHTIEFTLVDFTARLEQEMKSLELKTTETYVFSRDRLLEGLPKPYLKTEEYNTLVNLKDAREKIGKHYLDTFINVGTKTLTIPGQPSLRIYDSFLTEFVLSTLGYLQFHKCLHIKQLPIDGDIYLQQPQFWKAILNADRTDIEYGNKQMKLSPTSAFRQTTYVKSLFSSRMDSIVYPYRPDVSTNTFDVPAPLPVSSGCIKPTTGASGSEPSYEEKFTLVNGEAILAYPRAHVEGYYVLSKAFYENIEEELSLLEIMTRDYLDHKSLSLTQVSFMASIYPTMPRLEQFYYGPLIMALIQYADKRLY